MADGVDAAVHPMQASLPHAPSDGVVVEAADGKLLGADTAVPAPGDARHASVGWSNTIHRPSVLRQASQNKTRTSQLCDADVTTPRIAPGCVEFPAPGAG